MRAILFFVIGVIPNLVFCQEENLRGTIQIKKEITDTCFVTVLGYSAGTHLINKTDVFKIKKIELNNDCLNYEIYRFQISCKNDGVISDRQVFGSEFNLKNIEMTDKINSLFVENIIIRDKNSGLTKNLSPIIFKVVD